MHKKIYLKFFFQVIQQNTVEFLGVVVLKGFVACPPEGVGQLFGGWAKIINKQTNK
jgi:hypothetical protein